MQAKADKQQRAEKPKRKLTRAEKKQIEAVIRQAKGDEKTTLCRKVSRFAICSQTAFVG